MELKHLRSFVALAEELHFGRAAERLHIVQPALSMQIKTLEEELNVILFERDRHKVALSRAGEVFLPEARATLNQAQHAVKMAQHADSGEIGRIRLSFVSSVLPHFLPQLIRSLHERYPLIELELKDMPSPDQLSALRDNRIDFGLVRMPVEQKGLFLQKVLEEPFIVALSVNHPLAVHESLLPAQLEGQAVLMLARHYAPGLYDGLLIALSHAGLTLNIAQELGEFTTMIALVAAGLGAGIIPAYAAAATFPGVVTRPLQLTGFTSSIALAWTSMESSVKKRFFETVCTIENKLTNDI